MKSLSIAILEVLHTFGRNHQAFTLFDVTLTLRNQVNAGQYSISGAGTTQTPGGQTVQEITHTSVRQFVRELFDSKTTTLARKHGIVQGADLYFFPGTDLSAYTPVVSGGVQTSSPAVSQTVATSQPATNSVGAIDGGTQVKIRVYLANRKAEGKIPTLKQVQSRLKGTPISLKDIADFVVAESHALVYDSQNPVLKNTKVRIA